MASFDLAIPYLLQNEAGFQKNPNDHGNYYNGELLGTKYGISAPVARANGWMGRMEDLPLDLAKQIYRSEYWHFDGVQNQAVATKLLDLFANGGSNGTKIAQRAVNRLVDPPVAVDGLWGPDTLDAINTANPSDLLQALAEEAASFYHQVVANNPSQETFLQGWLNRAAKLPEMVGEIIEENPGTSISVGTLLMIGFVAMMLGKGKA